MITHPEVKNWIKYARFEEKNSYINSARGIYERAIEYFGEDNMDEKLIVAFAKFEESQREVCELVRCFNLSVEYKLKYSSSQNCFKKYVIGMLMGLHLINTAKTKVFKLIYTKHAKQCLLL